MTAMNMRFEIVLYHYSSSFNRSFRVRPVIHVKVIVAEGEFSFMRNFGFCNRGNGNVVISTVVLLYLSLRGYIKASDIISCNGKI